MAVGAWPAAKRLRNLVRGDKTRAARSGEGQHTASRRWLGRRPDGPGAEPFGKDLTPLLTTDSLRMSGGGAGPEGRVGGGTWGASPASPRGPQQRGWPAHWRLEP